MSYSISLRRLTCHHSATWLVLTCLWVTCKQPEVISPNTSPDTGTSGKSDAAASDAPLAPADAAADVSGFWVQPEVGPSDTVDDGACTRSVNLRGVTISRPVPFDVVIVADNSDSLSWSHDSLSSGLKNLLSRVHGHEARFFVLTATQYETSSQDAVSALTGVELVSWRNSVTGDPFANAVTRYYRICTDPNGAATTCPKLPRTYTESWKVKGTWEFQMPTPVAAITADMDDDQIAAQQKKIADAILAVGGGGSPQEQPVCTLLRYMGQAAALLPKHAVFVVLTDEDDTSLPDACLAGYDATQTVGAGTSYVACESDCPRYIYYATRPNQQLLLDFTCVPLDDKGKEHPESATKKSITAESVSKCGGDAGVTTTGACIDTDLTKAGLECGALTQVKDCTRTCTSGKSTIQCSLYRTDNKTDLCTQPFDESTKRYSNLLDYCAQINGGTWSDCRTMGLKPNTTDGGGGVSYSESKTSVVPTAKTTADMIQTFKKNADSLIGKGNYSVEAIVLDPSFSCPIKSGQSYATNLRTLASSSADVFPLCEDYAPAIERIASFADYLIQTSFPLDLDKYEGIDSVVVTTKQGVKRTIPPASYRYDRTAKLLVFNSGVLTAQDDSLDVNVARYCEPIP
jgi:hypothetical protein